MDRFIRPALLLIFLISPFQLLGQSPATSAAADTTLARSLFLLGVQHQKKGQHDSSNYFMKQASAIYLKKANELGAVRLWELQIESRNYIGDNLRELGEYDHALKVLQSNLQTGLAKLGRSHDLMGETHTHLGTVNAFLADYDEAIKYYLEAIDIFRAVHGEQHQQVAKVYNNLANVLGDRGDLTSAKEYYERAIAIISSTLGEHYPRLISPLMNNGTTYHTTGDYDRALEYYQGALSIAKESLGEDHPRNAVCRSNIGILFHSTGRFHEALDQYDQAVEILIAEYGDRHFDVADNYENMAITFSALNDFAPAITYLEKALDIFIEVYGPDHPEVASCYNALSEVFYKKGDYAAAMSFAQKDLTISRKTFGEHHANVAQTYLDFARIHAADRKFDLALTYAHKAMLSLCPDFKSSNPYTIPPTNDLIDGIHLLKALDLKGQILSQLHPDGKEHLEDLRASLANYQCASDLIDKLRVSYLGEGSKLILGEKSRELYDHAIRTALTLRQATGNEKYLGPAFSFVEKGRAAALAQILSDSRARQFSGIPDSLLQLEKSLRVDLAYYETAMQNLQRGEANADQARLRELKDRHFSRTRQYDHLLKRLEQSYAQYFNMKYQIHTASLSEVQASLDDSTALLEYFVGDSDLCIFAISHGFAEVRTVKRDSTLLMAINRFSKSLRSISGGDDYVASASQLYRFLIEPIATTLAGRRRWIIIPDAELNYIPFEALLTKSAPADFSGHYNQLAYLMRKHEISYHNSATLLLRASQEFVPRAFGFDFVGFAPVFRPTEEKERLVPTLLAAMSASLESMLSLITRDGETFSELKYSETEVRGVQQLFGVRGQAFVHQEANEASFKTAAKDAKYVHVATHGIVDSENPKLSYLAFYPFSQPDHDEDGILYAGETYNLGLDADLLVLSSCQSGTGRLAKGEGLMALTRGFLYSGARNIIASLWNVYDEHTSELMVELYRQILAGKTYSAALREAKLKMAANEATAAPQSWAGFVLIGR